MLHNPYFFILNFIFRNQFKYLFFISFASNLVELSSSTMEVDSTLEHLSS